MKNFITLLNKNKIDNQISKYNELMEKQYRENGFIYYYDCSNNVIKKTSFNQFKKEMKHFRKSINDCTDREKVKKMLFSLSSKSSGTFTLDWLNIGLLKNNKFVYKFLQFEFTNDSILSLSLQNAELEI